MLVYKKKINVIFDISVLISGMKYEQNRTGVYRVAENIFLKFKSNPKFKIIPSVGENYFYISETHMYSNLVKRFFYKLMFKVFSLDKIIRITQKKELALLKRKSTIYYTPFYSVPSFYPEEVKRICFQTIYDLIPIKFPSFFENNANLSVVSEIIDSLSPDMKLFCISQSTKNDLLEIKPTLSSDRIYVTHLAANFSFQKIEKETEILKVKAKYKIPKDKKYFLTLSTIEPRKNIDMVVSAFQQLGDKISNEFSLVLAGTMGWGEKHGLISNENIFYTGFVPDEDIPALYSGAYFFIYPSLYEGFGLPPLEAMKCGTPVITSNASSLPEVVGNAGIYISPYKKDELEKEMLNVAKHPELRISMSKKALLQADLFSWDKCVSIMEREIYQTIDN